MNSGKPFLVVVFFIILIALFAGGAMSDTDLTPNTPPSSGITGGPQTVMGVQNVSSGICGSVYQVRSGDTLSRIAQNCGVSLQDLLAVNPNIGNANLIHPGQKINLVYRVTETPLPAPTETSQPASTEVPPPAAETSQPAPAENIQLTQPVEPAQPDAITGDTGVSGLRPGGKVVVKMGGFPAESMVMVTLSPVDGEVAFQTIVKTDPAGKLDMQLNIPITAKPGDSWVVKVTTVQPPNYTISAPPFVIEK